jgi:hypothetical protein
MKSAKLIPVIVAAALASCGAARADQCAWNDKEVAAKATEIVKPDAVVLEFCEPCRDKQPGKPFKVKKATVREPKAGYFELVINGHPVDLAYLFVRTEEDVFVNVGVLANCDPKSVSTEIRNGKPTGFRARPKS